MHSTHTHRLTFRGWTWTCGHWCEGGSTHPMLLSRLLRFLDHMVAYLLMRGDAERAGRVKGRSRLPGFSPWWPAFLAVPVSRSAGLGDGVKACRRRTEEALPTADHIPNKAALYNRSDRITLIQGKPEMAITACHQIFPAAAQLT